MVEKIKVIKASSLRGIVKIPGDKSISHRSVILGSIAEGRTLIKNFLAGEDCIATINCFKKMGIRISRKGNYVKIYGMGLYGLKEPKTILNTGNSGTTIRLLSGILSAQPFTSVITGDKSLRKRPMLRVMEPLRLMGAEIKGKDNDNFAPLIITGRKLSPIKYKTKVASAQVKSAIVLASLYVDGKTTVREPVKSRDHTERMLRYFGADIRVKGLSVFIKGQKQLRAQNIIVPGDISSAAFFLIAALIVPDSKLKLLNVGINPTRTGILDVLKKMGAKIKLINKRNLEFEPVADIIVKTSPLKGITIKGKIIPRLIDEIPILAVAASLADGRTVFKDIGELRIKESDRIAALSTELRKFGIKVIEKKDGMIIYGNSKPIGCKSLSYGDHRIAMALAILGLVADGKTEIKDTACIRTSLPDFKKLLKSIRR